MLSRNTSVKRILIISLSNIGDVVLTFPVIDVVLRDFPGARVSVVVGPKAAPLLEGHPRLEVIRFDKKMAPFATLRWLLTLRERRFDVVVDLRRTAMAWVIGGRWRTPVLTGRPAVCHMRDQHLQRLKAVHAFDPLTPTDRRALWFSSNVRRRARQFLGDIRGIQVMAPTAADGAKQWPEDYFIEVGRAFCQRPIVLIGGREGRDVAQRIAARTPGCVNLCGRLTLVEAAYVLKRAAWLLSNDSAPMHLASYLDVPVLAVFGPTSPEQYGPWGRYGKALRTNYGCPACAGGQERHTCLESVKPTEVIPILMEWSMGSKKEESCG